MARMNGNEDKSKKWINRNIITAGSGGKKGVPEFAEVKTTVQVH